MEAINLSWRYKSNNWLNKIFMCYLFRKYSFRIRNYSFIHGTNLSVYLWRYQTIYVVLMMYWIILDGKIIKIFHTNTSKLFSLKTFSVYLSVHMAHWIWRSHHWLSKEFIILFKITVNHSKVYILDGNPTVKVINCSVWIFKLFGDSDWLLMNIP